MDDSHESKERERVELKVFKDTAMVTKKWDVRIYSSLPEYPRCTTNEDKNRTNRRHNFSAKNNCKCNLK